MDDNEDTPKERLIPFATQALLERSAAIVRRGLHALIGQEGRADARKDLVRTLLQQLITLATEAIYSERFDFDAIVARLSHDNPGIALLRAYVAIQTATQLAEPLDDADIDRALQALRSSEQRIDAPEFQAILDVHKQLAKFHWLRRHNAILRGKLANKNDENSYEGTVYSLEREKKGPTTKEERAQYEPICKQMAHLNRQIEEEELRVLKDSDEQEYHRYKEELESWALREEIQTNEDQAVEFGVAEAISLLETQLDALLHNAEQSKGDRSASQISEPPPPPRRFNAEMLDLIQRLAANRVAAGITTANGLVDAVYEAVSEAAPGINKREVRKAICGYGYGWENGWGKITKRLRELESETPRNEGAILSLRRASDTIGDDTALLSEVLETLSLDYQRAGRFEESADVLEIMIDLVPDEPRLNHLLGCTYEALEWWSRAERAYGDALDLDPDNEETKIGLEKVRRLASNEEE